MFPGQPLIRDSELPVDADFIEIAALTHTHTGLDLSSFTWSNGTHLEHAALQVYGVAMSLYRHRRLLSEGTKPDLLAEHSMGIYAALAACGSIGEGDALEMAFRAGVSMAHAFSGRAYALGCVTGLTEGPLAAIGANNGVYLVNYNTSRHFLLAGPCPGIEAACLEAAAAGAFSTSSFPCDAPLHTPLMEEIGTDLSATFSDYRYHEPRIPLVEHIGQQYLAATAIPDFLRMELCSPVYWERTCRALCSVGIKKFHEVGAGQALTKFNRWIESGA
jgi:malonyl CoA-acyl carrier protein transacylase